ncbi:hypothetical protein [Hyphobacterium sp.]|uniref:hypothetical protein n=1 Tax=Hyphobacterium sp. TaxID=2004662 RepID=UPI003B523F3A
MVTIDWKTAAGLALAGPLFGAATIFALIQGLEHYVALAAILVIGVASAVRTRRAAMWTAFAAGFLAALSAVLLQAIFIDTYFDNNPEYAEIAVPLGFSAAAWTTLFAPVGGLVMGVLCLLVAAIAKLVMPKGPAT